MNIDWKRAQLSKCHSVKYLDPCYLYVRKLKNIFYGPCIGLIHSSMHRGNVEHMWMGIRESTLGYRSRSPTVMAFSRAKTRSNTYGINAAVRHFAQRSLPFVLCCNQSCRHSKIVWFFCQYSYTHLLAYRQTNDREFQKMTLKHQP